MVHPGHVLTIIVSTCQTGILQDDYLSQTVCPVVCYKEREMCIGMFSSRNFCLLFCWRNSAYRYTCCSISTAKKVRSKGSCLSLEHKASECPYLLDNLISLGTTLRNTGFIRVWSIISEKPT